MISSSLKWIGRKAAAAITVAALALVGLRAILLKPLWHQEVKHA